jgi:hypothetical protein
MRVYLRGSPKNMQGQATPIVVESNIAWALPYWRQRRLINPDIYWVID